MTNMAALGVTIHFTDLRVSYGYGPVLDGLSGTLRPRTVTALIGPNGSGKSTLLRTFSGLLPYRGSLTMDGRELSGMSRRQVARMVGLVPQQTKMTAQFTVYDAVALGRLPHQDLTGKLLQEDEKLIQDAVTRTELDGLLLREVSQLSGGEAQRVAVAMVLAQAPSVFLLDEPSSALDPRHTVKVFSLLRSLVGSSQSGKIVVAAVHDVNLAVRFADFFLAMKNGKILSGAPVGALDENILEALYDVPFESYVSSKGEKAWHTK